jgi:signal transduction histidine kinase/ActR/RegA family two-component response regulator
VKIGLVEMSRQVGALVRAGSRRLASDRERRQTIAANVMGLGLFAISWPYIVFFALANEPLLSLAVLLTCMGYLSAPVLNSFGHHMAAKVAPCASGIAVCYIFGSTLGPDMHIHVSMVMLTGWAFNLFDVRRNPRALLFFATVPGILYAFVEFGVVLPLRPIQVAGVWGLFIGVASLGFSYLLLVWVLWIFYAKNLRNEDSLEHAVSELQTEVGARKQAQNEAQSALATARNADQAKSRFLASMSHEFRTPLNGVLGAAQLLNDSGLNTEQHTLLRDVNASGTALLTLLDNVLDVAMMDKSALRIQERAFDLPNLLEESLQVAQTQARRSELVWRNEVQPGLPKQAVGDEQRLRQVLYHLLNNAAKFTHRGEVVLRASATTSTEEVTLLTVAVEDTGIGIPTELRESIFEAFTQVDGGLDRAHGGAGLGLALCRSIITAMRGTIAVRAREGGGSIFEFRVPLKPQPKATEAVTFELQAAKDNTQHTFAEPQILVAEDNPVNLKLLLKLLEKLGLKAVTCENGLLALNLFKSGKWDLVLMDVQMPEMDGITATRAIREFESAQSGQHTPVIAVSANILPEHIENGLQAGFDVYMTKPVKLPELRNALETFIRLPRGPRSAGTTV